MMQQIRELRHSTSILIKALAHSNTDKATEAISVMLLQFIDDFADNEVVASQFFPVLDRLKIVSHSVV